MTYTPTGNALATLKALEHLGGVAQAAILREEIVSRAVREGNPEIYARFMQGAVIYLRDSLNRLERHDLVERIRDKPIVYAITEKGWNKLGEIEEE